jgi:cysteine desulfurase / selenocysteine lyase
MTIDRSRLREDFPYLAERCYLNTAAAGLSWVGQGNAAAGFYSEAKARGINGREMWFAQHRSVVPKVKRLLGAFEGNVEFFSNTTEVLNLVAHSFEWRSGDEVVYAADEFPSVEGAFNFAAARGVTVRKVVIREENLRSSDVCSAIGDRTRVVVVSHVHWATGTVANLSLLGAACRKHNALLVVDGIQAMGAITLDLSVVDIYCGSVFKWLLSGFGLSICAIGPRAAARLHPAYRGYANLEAEGGLRYAHMNYPGIYALNAALDFLDGYGWLNIFDAVKANADRMAKGVEEAGFKVLAPEEFRAGIVSFRASEAETHQATLAMRGVDVEARFGILRCSPHFYNTSEDVDRLLAELRRL